MRMWMVEPKWMCRKHLLGEHVEHHMFVGTINKKKQLNGYVEHNCVEPSKLRFRHDELVLEMDRRGYKHNSKLPEFSLGYLPKDVIKARVNVKKSLHNLMRRCHECRCRWFGIDYIGGGRK